MVVNGKIGFVNLSTGEIKTEVVSPEIKNRFLGGRGVDIYLLLTRLKAKTIPLSPDNVIAISTGLLTGTLAATSGRTHIAAKSPITSFLGGANLGGFFAPELRRAGFDHLVITGKARKPVYIFVDAGKISIHNASTTWGQTTANTQEILRKELGDDDIQTICIGPAGEHQIRFASVMTRHQSGSGRDGMGAVFGSKNLKAVAARGKGGIQIAHPEEALSYDHKMVQNIITGEFGRSIKLRSVTNFNGEADPFSEYTIGRDGCYGCQLACRQKYAIKSGPYAGIYGQGPGYQAKQAWEKVLGEKQPAAILAANYLVNAYGIDALEAANLIGWAMRLYDEGILTEKDTGGLDLRQGNAEAVNQMIEMIAHNEGLGGILAEGGVKAAARLGRDSASLLTEIKGTADIFGEEPLSLWQVLGLGTATRAADHLRYLPSNDPSRLPESILGELVNKPVVYNSHLPVNKQDHEGIAWLVNWTERSGMVNDMMGVCDFHTAMFDPASPGFDEFSRMIYLNTGLEISAENIWEASGKAYSMERQFNLREGYDPANEQLEKWYPLSSNLSYSRGIPDNLKYEKMLKQYYEIHGWSTDGRPGENNY